MICSRCGLNKVCLRFREVGNDGKKSYTQIIPMCGDCMVELHFPFEQKELNWD